MAVLRMSSGGRTAAGRGGPPTRRAPVRGAVLTALAAGVAVGVTSASASGDVVLANAHVDGYPRVVLTVDVPPDAPALAAADIAVSEDGRPVAAQVSRLAADGLEVVLVVDTSAAAAGGLGAVRAAATDLVDRLPGPVRVGLVASGPDVRVIAPPTRGRAALGAGIASLAAGDGAAPLYDAVVAAGRAFTPEAREGLVVLVTAAGDRGSAATLDEAVASVAGRRVEVVSLETPETSPLALARLAIAGRGDVSTAASPGDVAAVTSRVADALLGRYTVAYDSTGHGPVEVRVATPVGEVRSRLELPAADPAAAPAATAAVPAPTTPAPTTATPAPTTAVEPSPAASTPPATSPPVASSPAPAAMTTAAAAGAAAAPEDPAPRRRPHTLTALEGALVAALVIAVLVRHVGARLVASLDQGEAAEAEAASSSAAGSTAPAGTAVSPSWPAPVADHMAARAPVPEVAPAREVTSVG